MDKSSGAKKKNGSQKPTAITKITVSGFKSIVSEQSIDISPLTILAGANSSGKSSMMQPLLLMKQTLEATYDPGVFLLDGPNVKFTSWDQLLGRDSSGHLCPTMSVGFEIDGVGSLSTRYRKVGRRLVVDAMDSNEHGDRADLRPKMSHQEILAAAPYLKNYESMMKRAPEFQLVVVPERCFLTLQLRERGVPMKPGPMFNLSASRLFEPHIRDVIHLPGLRGNPERTYPRAAVGDTFPGAFQDYAASVVLKWESSQKDKLRELNRQLLNLGLAPGITASNVQDTSVEIRVGRLMKGGTARSNLVSIADVGFGVSQALPVLVALLVAQPGQVVYLEQPEIHLHPRAQYRLATVLAQAAKRGVRIVAETHSSLLLLGVQSLVAQGELSPDLVRLHWFQRDEDGATRITTAELDQTGAFGDWPEDFAEVELDAQSKFIRAASALGR